MYMNVWYRSQFQTNFHEIQLVGAGPPMDEPYFFGNNRPNRITDMGENMPLKLVFWLSFRRYKLFWRKNFKIIFGTPFSIEKVIFPLKMAMPPKKMLNKKYSKPHFLQKRFYWLLLPDAPFHSKWSFLKISLLFRYSFSIAIFLIFMLYRSYWYLYRYYNNTT